MRTNPNEELVPTPVGTARLTWYPAHGTARAVALLGHGSATGVDAPDLQALAEALPRRGVTVALLTQPYRQGATPRPADGASRGADRTRVPPYATSLPPPVVPRGQSCGSKGASPSAAPPCAH